MSANRNYTIFDRFCLGFDQGLRALTDNVITTGAPFPAKHIEETELSDAERKHVAALMRINHAGEICAQALYNGQAFLSRNQDVQFKMQQAAKEESDHLHWCRLRLDELNSHTSYLNLFWYSGSFIIGMAAAMAGDEWSLGFVAETETQVITHLGKHINLLPKQDKRSESILLQMEKDEAKHRHEAIQAGARELPYVIKKVMSLASKIMVKSAYWI